MKAIVWHGKEDVRVDNVADPALQAPGDILLDVTLTAICGSDLHLYDGYNPTMEDGDILGHEFMGRVIDVGSKVTKLKKGDRVVVPFTISCGRCFFCEHEMYALCDNTNPNKEMAEKANGFSSAGLFGYSHMFGPYAGGQAQFVRVPHADVGPIRIPEELPDERVLFLSDILPTGYMAAENCAIQAGDTVAVWGCGPVGQMAIKCAFLMDAGRVIAIDRVPERLALAEDASGAETINYEHVESVIETLKEMTGGRGPDCCIDAVGMEAHGKGLAGAYDKMKQAVRLETDRPTALREVMQSCRKGGTVSIPGVYTGLVDKIPFGSSFAKGLTLKMGQTHVQKYMPKLLALVQEGKIDPSFVITHRLKLDDGPHAYKIFRDKEDNCIKVVMKP